LNAISATQKITQTPGFSLDASLNLGPDRRKKVNGHSNRRTLLVILPHPGQLASPGQGADGASLRRVFDEGDQARKSAGVAKKVGLLVISVQALILSIQN
jgi:hypothetical protein